MKRVLAYKGYRVKNRIRARLKQDFGKVMARFMIYTVLWSEMLILQLWHYHTESEE